MYIYIIRMCFRIFIVLELHDFKNLEKWRTTILKRPLIKRIEN